MNLLLDEWLPVQKRDGEPRRISLLHIADPAISSIASPRPDFTAALTQLAIGVLQTAFAPKSFTEWQRRYEKPPSQEQLQEALVPWQHAFELDAEKGPAFFQDFDPIAHAEAIDIAKLLIDNPGDQTVNNNNDLFLHAGGVQRMCPACAASALLTLQINAPSGGAGHRVSLRGGGPLTTFRLPRNPNATLFQKVWSNVVPADAIAEDAPAHQADVMPWLAATRTSDKGGTGDTTPVEAHELQGYFSMPRRIRLDWKTTEPGTCDICGEHSERCLRQYRTRPYGVNYMGAWQHPLTPYVFDAKQANLPISIKGQKGGVGYRHWLGLAVASSGPAHAARIVTYYNNQRDRLSRDSRDALLWACGYDMDNMKARCWYDATLPLPTVPPGKLNYLTQAVSTVLDAAGEMAALVRKQAGLAVHPDGTGDPAVSQSFWQASETAFYTFLQGAMDGIEDDAAVAEAAGQWLVRAREASLQIFDAYVIAVPLAEGDMQSIVEARAGLERSLFAGKSKALWNWIASQKGAAA